LSKKWTKSSRLAAAAKLRHVIGTSLCALAASAAAACAQSAPGKLPTMTDLSFGETGISFSVAPYFVAKAENFFTDENLNVEDLYSGQSARVCQQILAGAVDAGDCSPNDVIQIDQKSGAQLILVSNEMVTALNYGMMTNPKIKTWADLKGKTIIVGGAKDNTVYFTRLMARANGLQDSDYDFLYAGASGARFAALQTGAVDAAMLTDPFDSEAEIDGFRRLATLRPKYISRDNYAGGGFVATSEWAKAHPQIVVAYVEAFKRTISWMYNPDNKDKLFDILKGPMNLSRDAFDRTYQKNIVDNRMWATDGGVTFASAVQGVLNSLVELGGISAPTPPPGRFYDNTYVSMANKIDPENKPDP
jgi:NitT/TauT family transport system substrate-binding protein